jgi:hypothetical protein
VFARSDIPEASGVELDVAADRRVAGLITRVRTHTKLEDLAVNGSLCHLGVLMRKARELDSITPEIVSVLTHEVTGLVR